MFFYLSIFLWRLSIISSTILSRGSLLEKMPRLHPSPFLGSFCGRTSYQKRKRRSSYVRWTRMCGRSRSPVEENRLACYQIKTDKTFLFRLWFIEAIIRVVKSIYVPVRVYSGHQQWFTESLSHTYPCCLQHCWLLIVIF